MLQLEVETIVLQVTKYDTTSRIRDLRIRGKVRSVPRHRLFRTSNPYGTISRISDARINDVSLRKRETEYDGEEKRQKRNLEGIGGEKTKWRR